MHSAGVPPPVTSAAGDDPDWHRALVTVRFAATPAAGHGGGGAPLHRQDRHDPVTWTQGGSTVHRGAAATLRYRVDDALSPAATVTIRIETPQGRTVRDLLATRATDVAAQCRVRCTMPQDTCRCVALARDLAGNAQTRAGRSTPVVR